MKIPASPTSHLRHVLPRNLLIFAAAGFLGLTGKSVAQSVIAAPPSIVAVPRALPQPTPTDSAPSTEFGPSPFTFNWLTLHPHFYYRYLYGDGLQAVPGQQQSTSIQNISPGVLFNLGNHWNLDYTPTKTYYSDPAFRDTLDHSLQLLGGAVFNDWTARFSQSYTSGSPTLVETGRQTREKLYVTSATVAHNFGNRTLIDGTFNHQTRTTENFNDNKDTSFGGRIHYQFTKHLDVSANLEVGYTDVLESPNMTYSRPTVQLVWRVTEKLETDIQAGVENRKFSGGSRSDLNTETFNGSVKYQLLPTTGFSLNANRGVSASYFDDSVTKNTGFSVGLQQRLLQRFFLALTYGNQKSTYVPTTAAVIVNRDDRINTFNARLSTVFIQKLTAAVFYQTTRNDSSRSGFGFNSRQVGFELGYRF